MPHVSSGLITHIQRFSVHDGPGIRTTVFLKGCQMRCSWCHNPETLRPNAEIQVFPERCIGCRTCESICRQGAHAFSEAGHGYDRGHCVVCGECVDECYAKALVRVGEARTAESVVSEVLADRAFYEPTGGVTISGGEPLLQSQFTADILARCRQEEIHTAVETNLAWAWRVIEPLVPLVDLFLVDIKTMDDEAHRKWTDVSNRQTLENLRQLDELGRKMIVRTPVVAGVNERPDQIGAVADFLSAFHNLEQYELLPYHSLGTGKYASLGLNEPCSKFRAPSLAELERLAAEATERGLIVKIAGGVFSGTSLSSPDSLA